MDYMSSSTNVIDSYAADQRGISQARAITSYPVLAEAPLHSGVALTVEEVPLPDLGWESTQAELEGSSYDTSITSTVASPLIGAHSTAAHNNNGNHLQHMIGQISEHTTNASVNPTKAVRDWSSQSPPKYAALVEILSSNNLLEASPAVLPSRTMPRPHVGIPLNRDLEYLHSIGGFMSEGLSVHGSRGSEYHYKLGKIKEHFQAALNEEAELSHSEVEHKYRAAREYPGEPVITSLLQASLEQCERESAARKAEIYAMTADAIRRLRASVMPERRRRNLRPKATKVLSDWYAANRAQPYPTDEQKRELALAANVEIDQVSNWFSNRRNRNSKKGGTSAQPS